MSNKTPPKEQSDYISLFDEAALEAELTEAEATEQPKRSWWESELLNKPITLWILSTFAVSIITFGYANYSSCQVTGTSDDTKFSNIIYELSTRIGGLSGAFANAGALSNTPDLTFFDSTKGKQNLIIFTNALKYTMDPNNLHYFDEFKSKYPHELTFEAETLIRKWHRSDSSLDPLAMQSLEILLEQTKSSKITAVGDVIAQGQQFQKLKGPNESTNPYLRLLDNDGLFSQLELWLPVYIGLDMLITDKIPSKSLIAIKEWATDMRKKLISFTESSKSIGVYNSYTCLSRAFWPF
jgi:hypothetical protein